MNGTVEGEKKSTKWVKTNSWGKLLEKVKNNLPDLLGGGGGVSSCKLIHNICIGIGDSDHFNVLNKHSGAHVSCFAKCYPLS